MKNSKYKSRKNRKHALRLKQTGNDGRLVSPGGISPMFQQLVERLKSVFGSSKHRTARVARFQSRQRRKR